ncbi:hypothetical protein JW911_03855, partial [Candidatus Peregrinibacteria bacterium]|nr:hypothetical protein [Candidatus Peregrinibacteria bacterium]
IIFIVLSALLLPACSSEPQKADIDELQNQKIDVQQLNENNPESGVKDIELLEKAVSGDLDSTKCEEIIDENLKNFCVKDIITTIAMNENNISKCNEIEITEDREYCINKVNTVNQVHTD